MPQPEHNRVQDETVTDTGWQVVLEQLETDPQAVLDLLQTLKIEANDTSGMAVKPWLQARALIRQGQLEEAREPLGDAVRRFEVLQDPRELESRIDFGRLLRDLGELQHALEVLDEASLLVNQQHNPRAEADVLNIKASVYQLLGESTEALERFRQVLDLRRQLGDRRGEVTALMNASVSLNSLGDTTNSLENLFAAYNIIRDELHDAKLEIFCLVNIGVVYQDHGDFHKAVTYYEQAYHHSQAQGDRFHEVLSLNNLADAYHHLAQHEQARNLFLTSLEQASRYGMSRLEIHSLDGLGKTSRALGEHDQALGFHELALQRAETDGENEGQLDALLGLGLTHLEQGQAQHAVTHFEHLLDLASQSNQRRYLQDAHQHLSHVFERLGQPTLALKHFKRYHQLERELLNEDTTRKTKNLTLQFDLERTHREAEMYRLRTQVTEEANAMLEDKVRERTRELEAARVEVVMRLAVAAEYRDDHTGQHTWRVGNMAALIAQELQLPESDIELLRLAARLHDVGKIGITDLIMLKPAKLTTEEYERMKTHTTIGAQILSGGTTALLKMAESIALTHHERWDGGGYPAGLQGEDIPLVGRIVAVADVYDALLSERPYKVAWTHQEALEEIQSKAGTQFDPQVVRAFIKLAGQQAWSNA